MKPNIEVDQQKWFQVRSSQLLFKICAPNRGPNRRNAKRSSSNRAPIPVINYQKYTFQCLPIFIDKIS